MAFILRQIQRLGQSAQSRFQRTRAGVTLIIVVGLLVLLALMGVAFLSTARSDRYSTRRHVYDSQMNNYMEQVFNQVNSRVVTDLFVETTPTAFKYRDDASADGTSLVTFGYRNRDYPYNPLPNAFNGDGWLADRIPVTTDPSGTDTGNLIWKPGDSQSGTLAPMWMAISIPLGSSDQTLDNYDVYSTDPGYIGLPVTENGNFWAQPSNWTSFYKKNLPPGTPTHPQPLFESPLYIDPVSGFTDVTNRKVIGPPDGQHYSNRLNLMPTYVQVGTTKYPALSYYYADQGGAGHTITAVAADADGDGIADSGLWRLSVSSTSGITWYAGYRVIDNCAALNVNTAWDNTAEYGQDPGTGLLPAHVSDPVYGGDLNPYGFFPSNIDLAHILVGSDSINTLNGYRFNFTPGSGSGVGSTYQDLSAPCGDTASGLAAPSSGGWAFLNQADALYHQLGRRPLNPGWKNSTTKYQALPVSDMVALAYRFCLTNSAVGPRSVVEQCLPNSTYAPSSGTPYPSTPYSPDQAANWYKNNFDFDQLTNGTDTTNTRPLRSILVTQNGITNGTPVKFNSVDEFNQYTNSPGAVGCTPGNHSTFQWGSVMRQIGVWFECIASGVLPSGPMSSTANVTAIDDFAYPPQYTDTVPAPWPTNIDFKFGDWVVYNRNSYLCLQSNGPSTTPRTPGAAGSQQYWQLESWYLVPMRANVNAAPFGELWAAYWASMVVNQGKAPYTNFGSLTRQAFVDSFRAWSFNGSGPSMNSVAVSATPCTGHPGMYQMTMLRSAIAAINTMQLRDTGNDVVAPAPASSNNVLAPPPTNPSTLPPLRYTLSRNITIADEGDATGNTLKPAYNVTVYGTDRQACLAEVFFQKRSTNAKGTPNSESANAKYFAIVLQNPYPGLKWMNKAIAGSSESTYNDYTDATSSTFRDPFELDLCNCKIVDWDYTGTVSPRNETAAQNAVSGGYPPVATLLYDFGPNHVFIPAQGYCVLESYNNGGTAVRPQFITLANQATAIGTSDAVNRYIRISLPDAFVGALGSGGGSIQSHGSTHNGHELVFYRPRRSDGALINNALTTANPAGPETDATKAFTEVSPAGFSTTATFQTFGYSCPPGVGPNLVPFAVLNMRIPVSASSVDGDGTSGWTWWTNASSPAYKQAAICLRNGTYVLSSTTCRDWWRFNWGKQFDWYSNPGAAAIGTPPGNLGQYFGSPFQLASNTRTLGQSNAGDSNSVTVPASRSPDDDSVTGGVQPPAIAAFDWAGPHMYDLSGGSGALVLPGWGTYNLGSSALGSGALATSNIACYPFGGFATNGDLMKVTYAGNYSVTTAEATPKFVGLNTAQNDMMYCHDYDRNTPYNKTVSDDLYEDPGRFVTLDQNNEDLFMVPPPVWTAASQHAAYYRYDVVSRGTWTAGWTGEPMCWMCLLAHIPVTNAQANIAAAKDEPAGTVPGSFPGTPYNPNPYWTLLPPDTSIPDFHAWAASLYNYVTVQAPDNDYFPECPPQDPIPSTGTQYYNYSKPPSGVTAGPTPAAVSEYNPTQANGPLDEQQCLQGRININTAPWFVLARLPLVFTNRNNSPSGPGQGSINRTQANVNDLARSIVRDRFLFGPYQNESDLLRVNIQFSDDVFGGSSGIRFHNWFLTPVAGDNLTTPASASEMDFSPFWNSADCTTGNFEKRTLSFNHISNLITTRSDSFTAYVVVEGWANAGTPTARLVALRRMAYIIDRSAVSPSNRTVKVIIIPNANPADEL